MRGGSPARSYPDSLSYSSIGLPLSKASRRRNAKRNHIRKIKYRKWRGFCFWFVHDKLIKLHLPLEECDSEARYEEERRGCQGCTPPLAEKVSSIPQANILRNIDFERRQERKALCYALCRVARSWSKVAALVASRRKSSGNE